MLNDVGLLKSFANDCVSKTYSPFYTIPKFSTHVNHVTGIVRKETNHHI